MLGLMLMVLSGHAASGQSSPVRVVAVTGDAPPNGDGRLRNSLWVLGGINESGQISFSADLIGTSNGSANDKGIYLWDGSALREIVRKGDPLPGGPGTAGLLSVNLGLPLNASGQVAYQVEASASSGGGSRLYRSPSTPGLPTLIARGGDASPTGKGFFGPGSDRGIVSESGKITFVGSIYSTPDRSDGFGIYSSEGTGITTIVSPNQPDATGAYLVNISGEGLSANEAGDVAFFAELIRSPNLSSETGLVVVRGGTNVHVVARRNQPVPDGAGSFGNLRIFNAMNEAGDVAFASTVTGLVGQYEGLYFFKNGAVTEVARSGFGAPDSRWQFSRFSNFGVNDRSQVAFAATVWDNSSGGVFRGDGTREGLVRLVGETQAAPNGNGTLSINDNSAGVPIQINDAGQVLFQTDLRGTTLGNSDDFGIFLYDDRLGLLTVARQGDPVLGSWFDYLSIASASLNERGDVAFQFSLFDGRAGVAIWSYSALANNRPPVGPSFQAAVSQGAVLTFSSTNLLQGVSDPDGGAVALNPLPDRTVQGGRITYSTFTRVYTYAPPTGFVGVDEFSYIIRDDAGVSTSFTGRINVSGPNRPPTSSGLVVHAQGGGESLSISLAAVLGAATDPDGDPISVVTVPVRTAGSVPVLREADTIRLTTDRSLSSDSLDITVQDGRGGSAPVRVSILLPDKVEGLRTESGAVVLTLVGSVGTWNVQRAPSPQGPWVGVGTLIISGFAASPSLHRGGGGGGRGCPSGTVCRGQSEFRDPNPPPGVAFYRMAK